MSKTKIQLGLLLIFILTGLVGCLDNEPWFVDGSKVMIDTRFANEIKQFWMVEGKEKLPLAETLLKDVSARELTIAEAENFAGQKLTISNNHHFYLIRGINVRRKPIPLRLYIAAGEVHDISDEHGKITVAKKQSKNGVIQVSAGTKTTCFMFSPGVIKQPLILSLERLPERVSMSYSCDGP
jgi:hypothetical protein